MQQIHTAPGEPTPDWGLTAHDYATWRPDYPDRFYERLRAFDVGRPDQRMLDLATGVGFLAHRFAHVGADVVAVDIAAGQIAVARERSERAGLSIDYRVVPAEATGLPEASFDVITASQCWGYFDAPRTLAECRRMLRPGGRLVICHNSWLPPASPLVVATENLIVQFSPQWSNAGWNGHVPPRPASIPDDWAVAAFFQFDEDLRFTRESWRGRIRASRGISATLPPDRVAAFDRAHDALLRQLVGDRFGVPHRISAHILSPR